MSWNLRPRKEQRIYIFEMPVLFFSRDSRNENESKVEKNIF